MKRLLSLVLAMTAAAAALGADPYVGYIYPAAIQPGTTNRFIVGGQNLGRIISAHFNCEGLNVLEIKQVPGFAPPTSKQSSHLKNWLDSIAKGVKDEPPKPDDPHFSEWRSNSWWQALGTLRPLELSIVEHYLYTPRNPLQAAPSLRQKIIVTIAADKTAKPGVYDMSVYNDGGISAPRPFIVTAHPCTDEPRFVPPHRKQPEPPFADAVHSSCVLGGQIMPGETDAFRVRFASGSSYRIKVTARELQPYIGDAVPGFFNPEVVIKDESGDVVLRADDSERFCPDPHFEFTPGKSGVYILEIHDVLYRGRADFIYSMEISPSAPSLHFADADAQPAACRCEDVPPLREDDTRRIHFSGTVEKPGAVCRREFIIEKPGLRMLEVTARRKASSLDAVLVLRSSSQAEKLAQWDDVTNKIFVGSIPQGETDSVGAYDFREPGRYAVEITDRTGHGGVRYFWDLEVRPPTPDFEVYSTRSTLPLYKGRSLKMDFVIARKDGFNGPVTLVFPKELKVRNNVATAGVDRISAIVTYVGKKNLEMGSVKISARSKIDGRTLYRDVVACDEYEQAFAWKHLVPAKSFIMRATPPSFKKRQKNVKR